MKMESLLVQSKTGLFHYCKKVCICHSGKTKPLSVQTIASQITVLTPQDKYNETHCYLAKVH